jgi:hypothetical protein
MDTKKAIGEATALGCIVFTLSLLIILTINGLTGSNYMIVIASNVFYEHYIELALVSIGLFFYIKTRKIKLRLPFVKNS